MVYPLKEVELVCRFRPQCQKVAPNPRHSKGAGLTAEYPGHTVGCDTWKLQFMVQSAVDIFSRCAFSTFVENTDSHSLVWVLRKLRREGAFPRCLLMDRDGGNAGRQVGAHIGANDIKYVLTGGMSEWKN